MVMKYTIDNDEIRAWIEEHGGVPATIKGMSEDEEDGVESADMLHISFDPNDPNMEEMDWEEFFERFENENLALVYDENASGDEANDFELVDRFRARDEYAEDEELPDSGDEDVVRENTESELDMI